MIVDTDLVDPVPWKNGGGLTRELLRWPAAGPGGQADWRVRLSVADITADGPFSPFPGVTRWFCVLEGDGVVLGLPDGERTLRPGDAPLRFDGADAPACRLIGGATRDLNLMLQGVEGTLHVARAGEAPPASDQGPWATLAFFEGRLRRLHWPCDRAPAPADGWWIGLDTATVGSADGSTGSPP